MTTNQQLDAILAKFPKNRAKDIQAAYNLGTIALDAKLAATPRPAATSPAAMPPLAQSILYSALLAKTQQLQIPVHHRELPREDKHRIGIMQTQNDNNLGYLTGLLAKHLRIGHVEGTMSAKAAATEYIDNFSTLLWEAMDAVLRSEDPVKAVALLRLMEEEGVSAVSLEVDTEPLLKVA